MSRSYKPETKATGKPPANKGLTAKQVQQLERQEAADHDALMAVQRARVFERYGVTPQVEAVRA
jgi:hypothetical protein